MNTTVHYLYHSGFAVQTVHHTLIFDYWRDTPEGAGLAGGVIDPAVLSDRDVIVFASHAHSDHFNRQILDWGRWIPRFRLILSDDIPPVPGASMIGPHDRLEQPDFTVETLDSTDQGVAFVVEVDGLTLYHAGDLNWWHWEGESEEYNRAMAEKYKAELGRLKGKAFDLAFVPVDPRLGAQAFWGIDQWVETVDARHLIPMHFCFGDDATVVDRLLPHAEAKGYRDRLLPLTKRGQTATVRGL